METPAAAPVLEVIDPAKPAAPAAPAAKPEGGSPAPEKNADGSEKKPEGGSAADKVGAEKNVLEAPDPTKPYEIKVDGKSLWFSKEEITKMAQKGLGADKRFQEAHKMKSAAEQFLNLLKTRPEVIFKNPKLGIDFKKMAQDILKEEIDLELMTPEQRKLHEATKKLEELENEKKTATEKQKSDQMKAAVKMHNENYERDITETLKTSGLPKTRETVQKIAYYLSEGLKQDVVLKAADVIHLVKKDYDSAVKNLFQAVSGDELIAFLGDDNVKKVNEALMRKIRNGEIKPPALNELPPAGERKKPEMLSKEEWKKEVDRRVAALG